MGALVEAIQRGQPQAPDVVFNTDLINLLEFYNAKSIELGIQGDVAEIGVANGSFFILLGLCCAEGEVAIAIDVFDDLGSNWNVHGGTSSIDRLITASERAGIAEKIRLVRGDSLYLKYEEILAVSPQKKVRLFSIDGSHSVFHTVNDLEIASRVISPGGIVFLDDVNNWGWPGAIEGFSRYSLLTPSPRIVPFLLIGNKFMLTTPCHHGAMFASAVEYAETRGRLPDVSYRVSTFFGWQVVGW